MGYTEEEKQALAEADKKIHKVEDQWHYQTMTNNGFKPVTKEAQGFVRKYEYEKDGYKIVCRTGAGADYFEDPQVEWRELNHKGGSLWSNLEPYLKTL